MAIQLFGQWHLTVTKAIHNWENRLVVQGAASGNGTFPRTVGLDVDVDGASWLLTAEYRESNAVPWKPSEMMIQAAPERVDVQAVAGGRIQGERRPQRRITQSVVSGPRDVIARHRIRNFKPQ